LVETSNLGHSRPGGNLQAPGHAHCQLTGFERQTPYG
jgi:hypothetical protein